MIGHIPRHLLHTLPALEEILQVHRALENLIQLLDVRDALGLGQREEFLFHELVRHEHFVRREIVVERQRRAVLDALGDGILVQVALVVLAAKRLERPLAVGRLVHRVPVNPMKVAFGRPAIRKLPRSPPVVRCASSISTKMFFRVFRLAGRSRNLWIIVTMMPR
jgi:hypothetical protein